MSDSDKRNSLTQRVRRALPFTESMSIKKMCLLQMGKRKRNIFYLGNAKCFGRYCVQKRAFFFQACLGVNPDCPFSIESLDREKEKEKERERDPFTSYTNSNHSNNRLVRFFCKQ